MFKHPLSHPVIVSLPINIWRCMLQNCVYENERTREVNDFNIYFVMLYPQY